MRVYTAKIFARSVRSTSCARSQRDQRSGSFSGGLETLGELPDRRL